MTHVPLFVSLILSCSASGHHQLEIRSVETRDNLYVRDVK